MFSRRFWLRKVATMLQLFFLRILSSHIDIACICGVVFLLSRKSHFKLVAFFQFLKPAFLHLFFLRILHLFESFEPIGYNRYYIFSPQIIIQNDFLIGWPILAISLGNPELVIESSNYPAANCVEEWAWGARGRFSRSSLSRGFLSKKLLISIFM